MKTQTLLMTLLVLMVTRNGSSDAYNWQSGSNGKVMWSYDCDFHGNDVGNKAISADKCGDVCAASRNCDHFTWNNGVCYMKMAVNPAVNYAKGAICGWVATSRPFGHIQYAIRWGLVPIRGVNLGGWLVVENWINSGDALWNGVNSTVSTTILVQICIFYAFRSDYFSGCKWRRICNDAVARSRSGRCSFSESLEHVHH